MTTPAAINHHGFISTSLVRKTGIDWPDIQLYFFAVSTYSQEAQDLSWIFSMDPKHYNSILEPIRGSNSFVIGVVIVRPKSLGEIRLRNDDPFSPPLIDPHYLEHSDDVQVLTEGMRALTKHVHSYFTINSISGIQTALDLVEKTSVFKKLNAHLPSHPLLGCEHYKMRSRPYWECYARHMGATLYHPTGSCRMGKDSSDPKAVVDSKLRFARLNTLVVFILNNVMP